MPGSKRGSRMGFALLFGVPLVLAACGGDQSSLEPKGPEAREIGSLFHLVFWIAVVIFVLVEGALLVSVVKHRMRKGEGPRPVSQVHGNQRLEIIWTIIPALLLAGIAVPTVRTLFDLRAEPVGERLDVNVIGYQWWWEFEYPGYGFRTANELHIPAGETVYLTMTSADVIHSFWVPPLNGKRDTVPGRTSHLTLIADDPTPPGEPILGQCAEFCGLSHSDMRVKVYVHTPEDFAAWAEHQSQPAVVPTSGPAAAGWELFLQVCAACHAVGGTDAQERLAPDLTHFASRGYFAGATYANTTEHLRSWLHDPSALKPMEPDRNDVAAGRILGMPNFKLSEEQIDNLVALLQGLE